MDMRLLWAWSNSFLSCLQKGGFRAVVSLNLFLWVFALPDVAVARLHEGSAVASSLVELQWSNSLHGFEGVQYITLPRSQFPESKTSVPSQSAHAFDLDFWILPNRDLHDSGQIVPTREQREFSQASASVEWPFSETGLGALTIRQVEVSEAGELCSGENLEKLARGNSVHWSAPDFERREFERSLRVNVSPKVESSCIVLRIKFDFFPREGLGNFAMQRDSEGVFSGPVHLLFKSRPLSTILRFRDPSRQLKMSCLGCSDGEDGWTEVAFHQLQPVLHFHMMNSPERTLVFAGASIFKMESKPVSTRQAEIAADVTEMVKVFEPAMVKLFAQTGAVWKFAVRPEILIESLIIGQPGEIQLGSAYGEFGIFLDSFQRAALFREISRNFLRHALRQSSQNRFDSWSLLEERERWVRIIAEIWVTEFFPDIFKIKDLSRRFSFLPFFRDLKSGKALLNNNIFLGREESGSALDFNLINEFFSPMTGAELKFRMKSCAQEKVFELLTRSAIDVAYGLKTVQDFMSDVLKKQAADTCTVQMKEGVFPQDVVSETVRVDNLNDGVSLTRQVDNIPFSKKFLVYADKPMLRERIAVDVHDSGTEKRTFLPAPMSEQKYTYSLKLKAPRKVSVVTPIRSSSSNRLVWPRPTRFALQSIALSYDSQRDDISAKSQVSFFQEGDDWSKNVSFGYMRVYSKDQINLLFSSGVPSFFPQFASSISIQTNVMLTKESLAYLALTYDSSNVQSGPLYPEGFSFKASLRRPLSLAAYAERMPDPNAEFVFGYSIGLAPRLTWRETLTYGASDLGVDVGLRDLSAWPEGEFISKEYGLIRSEIFHTLAHNHVVPFVRTVVFQHAVLYAAHNLTFDAIEPIDAPRVGGRTAQSISAGVRLYGALMGAKNQSLSFEVSRGLSAVPNTSYSFTVGRSIN